MLGANILSIALLFLIVEIAYRFYKDGFWGAIKNIREYYNVPYSNLGTKDWVVYDKILGYKLNSKASSDNKLYIVDQEVMLPKPKGAYRIIFLGDSIPFDNPSFVDYIKEATAKNTSIEIIKACVPGYTAYQELMFMQRDLIHATPNLVVWCYCLNDNHRFLHKFNVDGKMLRTQEAEDSLKINSLFDKIISRSYVLSLIKVHLVAKKLARKTSDFPWEDLPDFNIAWKDYSWINYEENLRKMEQILDKNGSKLCILIFPFGPQLNPGTLALNRDFVLKPQAKLKELCMRYHVPVLDLFSLFYSLENKHEKIFKDDGIHLTKLGHEVVSQEVIEFLKKQGLLY
ncbi:MAG: GDSL-type esterase/lipase family protein [Candidatus Omnitrophica bacterium]|nr:GDSL-type esterase/lipase family protein [Candidatus Omnitrophota bacterium]